MKSDVVQAPRQQFSVLRERVELVVSTILALLVTHASHMEGETHGVVSVRTGWKWVLAVSDCIPYPIFVGGVFLEVVYLV